MMPTPRCVLALLVLTAVGCGQSTSVSGKVTYNGDPVAKGSISFIPKGEGKTFSSPIESGEYKIPELVPGTYVVNAMGNRPIDTLGPGELTEYIAPEAEGNGIETEVQPGSQIVDLTITGPDANL